MSDKKKPDEKPAGGISFNDKVETGGGDIFSGDKIGEQFNADGDQAIDKSQNQTSNVDTGGGDFGGGIKHGDNIGGEQFPTVQFFDDVIALAEKYEAEELGLEPLPASPKGGETEPTKTDPPAAPDETKPASDETIEPVVRPDPRPSVMLKAIKAEAELPPEKQNPEKQSKLLSAFKALADSKVVGVLSAGLKTYLESKVIKPPLVGAIISMLNTANA